MNNAGFISARGILFIYYPPINLMKVQVVAYRDPLDPDWIIAEAICCGELITDQGRTAEDAVNSLREAILLLMEEKGINEELHLEVHEKISRVPRRVKGTPPA